MCVMYFGVCQSSVIEMRFTVVWRLGVIITVEYTSYINEERVQGSITSGIYIRL